MGLSSDAVKGKCDWQMRRNKEVVRNGVILSGLEGSKTVED